MIVQSGILCTVLSLFVLLGCKQKQDSQVSESGDLPYHFDQGQCLAAYLTKGSYGSGQIVNDIKDAERRMTDAKKVFDLAHGKGLQSYLESNGVHYHLFFIGDVDVGKITTKEQANELIDRLKEGVKTEISTFKSDLVARNGGNPVTPSDAYKIVGLRFGMNPYRTLAYLYAITFADVNHTDKHTIGNYDSMWERERRAVLTGLLAPNLSQNYDRSGQMYHYFGHASISFMSSSHSSLSVAVTLFYEGTMSELRDGEDGERHIYKMTADSSGREWARGLKKGLIEGNPVCKTENLTRANTDLDKKVKNRCAYAIGTFNDKNEVQKFIDKNSSFLWQEEAYLKYEDRFTVITEQYGESEMWCDALVLQTLKNYGSNTKEKLFSIHSFERKSEKIQSQSDSVNVDVDQFFENKVDEKVNNEINDRQRCYENKKTGVKDCEDRFHWILDRPAYLNCLDLKESTYSACITKL